MSISFQFAFDEKVRSFPTMQLKVTHILLWLSKIKKEKDASKGELYRAVRAGFPKTKMQRMASSLKFNQRPGVYEFVEMLILPQHNGQTIYVMVGLLNGKAYQARLHQEGTGVVPEYVKEVDDATFMRRVWDQKPNTVNSPIDEEAVGDPLLIEAHGITVQAGGNDYLSRVRMGPQNVQDIYQN